MTEVTPSAEILIQQFKTLLVLLNRPVVQQQLLLLGAILLAAYVINNVTDRQLNRMADRGGRMQWLKSLTYNNFSVLTLLFGYLVAFLLQLRGRNAGLIFDALLIFWLFFAYEIVVALLYLRVGAPATRRYRNRVLLPLLLLIVGSRLLLNFIGDAAVLGELPLFVLFNAPVTVGAVLSALLVLYIFLTFAWVVQDIIVRAVVPRLDTNPGVVQSFSRIGRYVMIAIGILVAIRMIGVDLTGFAIIGGGLSVGIGLGLQQLVNNFVSGIVLLFERSLRPGDMVKVNDEIGIVERIAIRSTVVRTFDNVEIIVPNGNFLSSQLTTFTKTDRLLRVSVPVGVSYSSDPATVRTVLSEAAHGHPLVLQDPAPLIFFNGFGDSSLDFSLTVWIDEAVNMPRVRSDLHFAVFAALAAHDIEIPFPQRDLHLRSGWPQPAADGESS